MAAEETSDQPDERLAAGPEKTAPANPWISFLVVSFCCGMASGLMYGQTLFVKLFANAGIYSSDCGPLGGEGVCKRQLDEIGSVFAINGTISLAASVFVGLLYDRCGARVVGACGVCLSAIGVFMTFICLVGVPYGYDAHLKPVFSAGALICFLGIRTKVVCLLGFLWHFPDYQGVIVASGLAVQQGASLLPLGMEAIMSAFGVEFVTVMFWYFISLGACTYLIVRFVPSTTEYYAKAEEVMGTPLPNPEEFDPGLIIKMTWDSWMVYPRNHFCFFITGPFLALPATYYAPMAAAYGGALFGSSKDGTLLAEIIVVVAGFVGLVLTPLGGLIEDQSLLLGVILVCFIVALALGAEASWSAQVVTASCLLFAQSMFTVFAGRYWLKYVTPNLFGTSLGLFTTGQALAFLPMLGAAVAYTDHAPPGPDAYRVPLYVCCLAGVTASLSYMMYYRNNLPPNLPPMLDKTD